MSTTYQPDPGEDEWHEWHEWHERHNRCLPGACRLPDDAYAPGECPQTDWLPCYQCGPSTPDHPVWTLVLRPGPVVNERYDATQTYRLACGHLTI